MDEQRISEYFQTAKEEGAKIHWGDETGLCNDSYHGRSYSPVGKPRQLSFTPATLRKNNICKTLYSQRYSAGY